MRDWRSSIVASTMLALILAGCASTEPGVVSWMRDHVPGAEPVGGGPADPFAFETFSGQEVDLESLKGNAVVLNFWASWCIPCRAEMPYFERVYREYRDRGVVFVGLAVEDDSRSARDFLTSLGVTYPAGMDRHQVANRYGLVGLPTTVFIGPDGKIARRWNGPVSESQLSSLVAQIAPARTAGP